MGVVYKAWQVSVNQTVGLKMILSGVHASDRDMARFIIEAEAIAALQHPNIVRIYEISQHDGRPYFTLEYLDGGALSFFFQAEDGIRDPLVTGVQTCALPI